jgi:hypothetical protein
MLRKSVVWLAVCAVLDAGCATEALVEAAQPTKTYKPRESQGVEVEWAADPSPRTMLRLCVVVRDGDGAAERYTVHVNPPDAKTAPRLVTTVKGEQMLVDSYSITSPGCDFEPGTRLPVVHLADVKSIELPAGADEAIYSVSSDSGWAVGYFSRKPLLGAHYSVDFDLSHTELFAKYDRTPQLLLALVPVTAAVEGAPWAVIFAVVAVGCLVSSDRNCFP